ncbi:MAG: hypothetical protein AB1716_23510, partial [Planctomycetota bacterium]
ERIPGRGQPARSLSEGIQTEPGGGLILPRGGVWPNGKRPCRIRELRITPGRVEVAIEPVQNRRRP